MRDEMRCEFCGEMKPPPSVNSIGADICWWNAVEELRELQDRGVSGMYVEGWGVRRRAGFLEPFQHGWVELEDGSVYDETPHHHCEKYFSGFRLGDPEKEARERGAPIPLHRDLGRFDTDAALAAGYAHAKEQAETFCREENGRERG